MPAAAPQAAIDSCVVDVCVVRDQALATQAAAEERFEESELAAVLWEHCINAGLSSRLNPGSYDTAALGLADNALSSVQVPKGLRVTLFENANFQGRTLTLTASAKCLGDPEYNFNDITSSIKVERV